MSDKARQSQEDFLKLSLGVLKDASTQLSPVLNNPIFTFKDVQTIIDITYRKINDWDEKNLISGVRENKDSGWRKFSIVDLIKLHIITDLKNFGLAAENISSILAKIHRPEKREPISVHFSTLRDSVESDLEYFYLLSRSGDKYVLVIKNNFDAYFATERNFVNHEMNLEEFSASTILLPFFGYVKNIANYLNEKEIKINEESTVKNYLLSFKEQQIMEIIRDEDYTQITISRSGSNKTIVRAKMDQKGKLAIRSVLEAIDKKDYQNIQIARVDGQIVNISREETFKV